MGILVRSPAYWPYALVQRDLDNVEVRLAREGAPHLESVELWHCGVVVSGGRDNGRFSAFSGETTTGRLLVIWILGSIIIWRARRFHISATYVVSFFLFAFLRSWITGDPWQAEVAPITGPMYQLFVFFMITDPKTTVRSRTGQCVVAFGVALAEFFLRLDQVVYAPIFALFFVGPAANLIEIWLDSRKVISKTLAEPKRVR